MVLLCAEHIVDKGGFEFGYFEFSREHFVNLLVLVTPLIQSFPTEKKDIVVFLKYF